MTNKVVGIGEARDLMSADVVCWFCQKQLSPRALFCTHCGTIQSVRTLDHFSRIGLERRVDIDQDLLTRQYTQMQKTLSPERFAIRSPIERGHAAKQLEALTDAYETLRDPVRRGRYWLQLHEKEFEETQAANPNVQEMRLEYEQAATTGDLDRVAQKASSRMEEGVLSLLQSLRQHNWQSANAMLVELDGMESIMTDARAKRRDLTTDKG